MKKNKIAQVVHNSLLYYKEIFDESERSLKLEHDEIPSKLDGERYIDFYFPKKIPINSISGFKLEGNKSFISFHEKWKYTNRKDLEMVEYVYKYTTAELEYECTHIVTDKKHKCNYSFHYDMDLEYSGSSKIHPNNHLQVLHNLPRFNTKQITVNAFLQLIKGTFFKSNGSLKAHVEPLFVL